MNHPKKGDLVYAEILTHSNAARRHAKPDSPESYIREAEVIAVGTKYIHIHWLIGGGNEKFDRETMHHVDDCGSEYVLHLSKNTALECVKKKLLHTAFRQALDYGATKYNTYMSIPYENIEKAARLLGITPAWQVQSSDRLNFSVGENVFFIYKGTDFQLHVGQGQIYRIADGKVLEVAHLPLKPNGFANRIVAFMDETKWCDYMFRNENDAQKGLERLIAAERGDVQ